jgi:hypothetical protein
MQPRLFVAQKPCSDDVFKQNGILFTTVAFCETNANSCRLLQTAAACCNAR